jgi:hypothetical protein
MGDSEKRLGKRITRVEKNVGEMRHLVNEICIKLDVSTEIPRNLPYIEPASPTPKSPYPHFGSSNIIRATTFDPI